jgi:phosphate:Na+ symporter
LVLLVAGHADVARQIAHAHVLFNVAGVLLFAPLVPLCQRLLDAWLPDQEQQAPVQLVKAA